jgi:hypothetical protein
LCMFLLHIFSRPKFCMGELQERFFEATRPSGVRRLSFSESVG